MHHSAMLAKIRQDQRATITLAKATRSSGLCCFWPIQCCGTNDSEMKMNVLSHLNPYSVPILWKQYLNRNWLLPEQRLEQIQLCYISVYLFLFFFLL